MRGTQLPIPRSARPPLWREARLGLEAAALLRDPVFRGEGVADGRGQPGAADPGLPGRRRLARADGRLAEAHRPPPSRAGMRVNVDCSGAGVPRLEERLEELVAEQGQRAAIVGQSRGGTSPRCSPGAARTSCPGIVTLGSPQLDPLAIHPLVRLQREAVGALGTLGAPGLFKPACLEGDCCAEFWEDLAAPLPRGVGYVSVYSRTDGIVDWQRLPRPARRARGDPRSPLRHGRHPAGLARDRGRPQRLPPRDARRRRRTRRGPVARPPQRPRARAPRRRAARRRAAGRAPRSPSSSGKVSTSVRTGTRGASAMNSSPSARVRLATERSMRSPQSSS